VTEGSDIEVNASTIEKIPAWINPEVDDPPKKSVAKIQRQNHPDQAEPWAMRRLKTLSPLLPEN
jgi:hypothetical protein